MRPPRKGLRRVPQWHEQEGERSLRYTKAQVVGLTRTITEHYGLPIDLRIWSPGDRYGTRFEIVIDEPPYSRTVGIFLGAQDAWWVLRAIRITAEYYSACSREHKS